MIDLKVKTLGGPEIAKTLAVKDSAIRRELRDELSVVGQQIVDTAQSLAPKRTGGLANRIIWYFGAETKRGPKGKKKLAPYDIKWKDGRIRMTVRPTGRVAHLMERGVNATFQQRAGRGVKVGQKVDAIEAMKWKHAQSIVYQRHLSIAPRPFFMPAVASVGGAAAVNARLQARLDRVAGSSTSGGGE